MANAIAAEPILQGVAPARTKMWSSSHSWLAIEAPRAYCTPSRCKGYCFDPCHRSCEAALTSERTGAVQSAHRGRESKSHLRL